MSALVSTNAPVISDSSVNCVKLPSSVISADIQTDVSPVDKCAIPSRSNTNSTAPLSAEETSAPSLSEYFKKQSFLLRVSAFFRHLPCRADRSCEGPTKMNDGEFRASTPTGMRVRRWLSRRFLFLRKKCESREVFNEPDNLKSTNLTNHTTVSVNATGSREPQPELSADFSAPMFACKFPFVADADSTIKNNVVDSFIANSPAKTCTPEPRGEHFIVLQKDQRVRTSANSVTSSKPRLSQKISFSSMPTLPIDLTCRIHHTDEASCLPTLTLDCVDLQSKSHQLSSSPPLTSSPLFDNMKILDYTSARLPAKKISSLSQTTSIDTEPNMRPRVRQIRGKSLDLDQRRRSSLILIAVTQASHKLKTSRSSVSNVDPPSMTSSFHSGPSNNVSPLLSSQYSAHGTTELGRMEETEELEVESSSSDLSTHPIQGNSLVSSSRKYAVSARNDTDVCPQQRSGSDFLLEVDNLTMQLKSKVSEIDDYLKQCTLSDEVSGILRTTIGKLKLLLSQKFVQFRGLCEDSLLQTSVDSSSFVTLPSDLEGFWDMVLLQVDDVQRMIDDVEKLRGNNWCIESSEGNSSSSVNHQRSLLKTNETAPRITKKIANPSGSAADSSARCLARERLRAAKREFLNRRGLADGDLSPSSEQTNNISFSFIVA